jgi:hypothetical protein
LRFFLFDSYCYAGRPLGDRSNARPLSRDRILDLGVALSAVMPWTASACARPIVISASTSSTPA